MGVLSVGFVADPLAQADEPPFHVLSSQDLCNLILAKFAGDAPSEIWSHLCKARRDPRPAMPSFFSNTFTLEPGAAPELPIGSVRVDPNNLLSDWIIPDCHVPGRLDCGS